MFILSEITRMYAGSKGETQYKPKGFHDISLYRHSAMQNVFIHNSD